MKNVTINLEKGFVDHRGLAFPNRDIEANRIVHVSADDGSEYIGFLPHCDELYETAGPEDVRPEMYSVIVPRDAFEFVWRGNQATDDGTVIESVSIDGDTVKLIRDNGNGRYAESWRIEKNGETVAYFDHEAIGMIREGSEPSFTADHSAVEFGGDIDQLIRMLMGEQSETE